MYAELMNENVRIRAENVMLRKVVFALIAQADKDPFMSIGHFAEHGHASSALAEIRALNDEQEQQPAPDVSALVEALRIISDIKDWDCDVSGGFLSIPVGLRRRMQDALAAYRQGGGE